MKREILFRGKIIDSTTWVYGDLVQRIDSDGFKHYLIENNDFNDYRSYDVNEESIGQFTGLLDRNGNKIFEGITVINDCGLKGKVEFFNNLCWDGRGSIHSGFYCKEWICNSSNTTESELSYHDSFDNCEIIEQDA